MIQGWSLKESREYLHSLLPLFEEIKDSRLDYSTEHTYLACYTPEIKEYSKFGVLVEYSDSYSRTDERDVPSRPCVSEFLRVIREDARYRTDFGPLASFSDSHVERRELVEHLVRSLLDETGNKERAIDVLLSYIHDTTISMDLDLFIWGLTVDTEGFDTVFGIIRRPLGSDFSRFYRVWGDIGLEFPDCYRPHKWDYWPYHSVIEWGDDNATKSPTHMDGVLEQATRLLDQLSLSVGVTLHLAGYKARTNTSFEPHEPLWDGHYLKNALFDWRGHMPGPQQLELKHLIVYNVLSRTCFPRMGEGSPLMKRVRRAISMYRESSRKAKDLEGILFTTIGLESLFTTSEQELRFKMAVRVAGIMDVTGNDKKKAYHDMLKAYGIRSKFVHGEIEDQYPSKWSELRGALTGYLRVSILVFLRLPIKSNIEIEKFHSMLDSMQIDDEAKTAVTEWVMPPDSKDSK